MTAMREETVRSVRDSRSEKLLEDRARWLFFVLALPLICFAIVRESLTSLVLLQVYLLTGVTAGILFVKHRLELRQEWFLKAIATSLPIHIVAAWVIFCWDKANFEIAFKGFYAIGIVWFVGVVEMLCIVGVIQLWKPKDRI